MTHVVVVGDALLDVDVDTHAERVAPDSGAPVLDEHRRTERAGGAALAARLAASDSGVEVSLLTALPDDAAGATVRAALDSDVDVCVLPSRGATGVKTRLRRGEHTVVRLDQGGAGLEVLAVPAAARALLAGADVVLVSDYGRGVTACAPLLAELAGAATRRPLVWDPHPRGSAPVPRARVVTPNAAEAARALEQVLAGTSVGAVGQAGRQARELVTLWGVSGVAVTLGARGAVLADGGDSAAVFPTSAAVAGDPCGAGDRFAARLATALAGGALTSEAVAAAVASATDFVAAGGVTVLDGPVREAQPAGSAALGLDVVAEVRARGGTVVATGGCFDLLHAGHLATLQTARSLGDCLIVCLNSDDSVRRQKGDGRPVQKADDRARVLAALRAVDAVAVFDEDTPAQLLATLRPDIWVKGGDYAGAELPESALVRSWGGEVITVPYLPGRSTTSIIGRART